MEDGKVTHSQKFSEMSFFGKIKHVCKVFVFVLTFGFAFPHLFSD